VHPLLERSFPLQRFAHCSNYIRTMAVENTVSSQDSLLPPILRLPPELRLKIYRLLLLSDQTVRMVWLKDSDSFPRPNCLFPAILRTCRVFYNEAADVLYGENVFRAHRIDDTNDNTASILRAKFLIGIVDPKDGEVDASKLLSFLETHPKLEHLVLEFGFNLLEDSKLRDLISHVLYRCGYSSRLTVRSALQSKRSSYNATQLEERVDTMALIRKESPELFKKIIDYKGDKSRWYAREPLN
jgi:hypothetical protein